MAHFAKISENNEVLSVVTLNDKDMLDANGVETESVGQAYLQKHNNWPAHLWIQTSYNTRGGKHYDANGNESADQSKALRGNFAGVGHTWDPENQIFWGDKPYPSWVKDLNKADWNSPIGEPDPLTAEQQAQNEAGTHAWVYDWNEEAYQADIASENPQGNIGYVLTNFLA